MTSSGNLTVPSRVVFNFLARCNMACPFCYCPFNGVEAGLDLWKRIIDQIAEWETKSITFGGGDPFLYDDFPELLAYTQNHRQIIQFIQVDTNGIGLRENHYPVLELTTDLIGLPLDGSDSEIHGAMRKHPTHFNVVLRHLEALSRLRIPVKINTVVSKKNIDDLESTLEVLSSFRISIWSLYEFWALGQWGTENSSDYMLSHEQYLKEASRIKDMCDFARVEIGSLESRHRAYFFVGHTGEAYTVHHDDAQRYVQLGSIFDEGVLTTWADHCNIADLESRVESRKVKLTSDGSTTLS